MKRWICTGLILALLLTLAGCGDKTAKEAGALVQAAYPEMAPYPSGEEYSSMAYEAWRKDQSKRFADMSHTEGMEAFLRETTRQFLPGSRGENRVYSPLNVYMALSMLAEVTEGDSRGQILSVLGCGDMDTLRKRAQALWQTNYCADGATATLLANSIWLDESAAVKASGLKRLADTFRASAYQGVMGSEKMNAALRDWLNTQTLGLLEESAEGITLEPQTVLALASTIAFQAKWDEEFSESQTNQGIFHAASGDVECDFMHQDGSDRYYWGDGFAAISKRFAGGEEMWFLLPDEGVTPEELAEEAQVMDFLLGPDAWENSRYLIVNQSIPRFDVMGEMELSDSLQALGITDVFDGSVADLSPILESGQGTAVSQVRHDARVTIDEEGCRAVAYAVIPAAGSAMPPKEEVDFVLDRPFLFAITGRDGLPLFLGIVNTLN
ncbi:MAG: hypothetical protein IJF36_05115 [Oscillibacter sp.]|nr:hypothetical protein [Oscillibacter sp.]